MTINYPLIISLIFFVNYALMFIHVSLHPQHHDQLRNNHAQEHAQRIDRGIGH